MSLLLFLKYCLLKPVLHSKIWEVFIVFAPVNFSHCDFVTHFSQRIRFGFVSKRYYKLNFESITMNVTESKAGSLVIMCPMNEMVWKQEYQVERIAFAMTSIVLNILSFPVTILMNGLVIMAVKTRSRLRSKYNILLACMAGTDLLVGAASQPTFIAGQISVIKGLSLTEYCRYHKETKTIYTIPILASLYHLTLVSIERFVAMKYTLQYVTIVTELRLKVAVVSSWVIACCPVILRSLSEEFEIFTKVTNTLLGCFSLSFILYCHVSVYFVTRRHEKQIKCEHVSPQAAADFAKEKKALKTTRIIIMALLVCLLPVNVHYLFLQVYFKSSSYIVNLIVLFHPVFVSFLWLNSLCNPIIYCYRNKTFRKTCKGLLKIKNTNFNQE